MSALTGPLWDQSTVAEHIGIPERTLEQWRHRKIGPPFIKLGRHVRYRPEDIEAWLNSQKVVTA